MNRRMFIQTAALSLLWWLPGALRAGDWPQFRGPNRDGVWNETGILESFPAGGLKIDWRAPVGPGFSSPIVAQGRVFVTDSQVSRPKARERVLCFDAKTGTNRWTHAYEVEYPEWTFDPKKPFGPRPTPIVNGGRVFTLGARGRLCCLDARDGRVVWQKDFENKSKDSAFTPSPLIEGDLLILVLDALPPGPCVVALDKDSGKELWRAVDEPATMGSPIILTAAGKRQLIVWAEKSVNSLDPATGRLYWRERYLGGAGYAVPTPVAHGDLLLVNGVMFKLDSEKPGASVLWPDGRPPSRQTSSDTSTAMFQGEHLFTFNLSGELVCIEAKTGRIVWATNQVTDAKSGGCAHITPNGESAFLFNDKGELIRARLAVAGYTEISRAALLSPTSPYGEKKMAWTPPAFADGRVFARSDVELVCASLAAMPGVATMAGDRNESFDRDPGWDGHNNRSVKPETIRQDFGWSPGTTNAGGTPGEIGGRISPAAEPAYYAKRFPTRTFNDGLSASGTVKVEKGGGHTLIGFFDDRALNEWRTRNTIALRIQQRGDVFHCHLEHCTSRWRAGAGIIGRYDKVRDRMDAKELPCGRVYAWSLKYDPDGNGGGGVVTATLDGDTASYELSPGHKADGAEFNHFGVVNVMKQFDGAGVLWLDNVTVNGEREEFGSDPRWDASGNRRTYETHNVRPRFDFGFSPTHHAGGKAAGELGGLFFRGDCRYADRLAAYGDRLGAMTLERPLRASGKVSLRRGVSDSTTLIGFYHSAHSLAVNPSQQFGTPRDFLGAAIEGPSSEGFYFYPVFRNHGDSASSGMGANPPRIHPDGATHDWTLEYDPSAANGNGRVTVSLDGKAVSKDLAPGDKMASAQFDRFGLVTPWIDGNGQHVYFDDLSYTVRQE